MPEEQRVCVECQTMVAENGFTDKELRDQGYGEDVKGFQGQAMPKAVDLCSKHRHEHVFIQSGVPGGLV